MKQLQFRDDDHYVEVQRKTVARRGIGPYFCDMEMIRIAEWIKRNGLQVRRGICHGARNGMECDELMRHLPLSKIVGTDLFPFSGKSKLQKVETRVEVIEWDFGRINNEWIDFFDVVYTNSLDHAREPEDTLKVWLDQLVWNGALFVQWNKSDVDVKGGDCFGADVVEYVNLMNEVGRLVDLIYVNIPWQRRSYLRRHGRECIVFVVRKKPE